MKGFFKLLGAPLHNTRWILSFREDVPSCEKGHGGSRCWMVCHCMKRAQRRGMCNRERREGVGVSTNDTKSAKGALAT